MSTEPRRRARAPFFILLYIELYKRSYFSRRSTNFIESISVEIRHNKLYLIVLNTALTLIIVIKTITDIS
jgi:hypothetical protein